MSIKLTATARRAPLGRPRATPKERGMNKGERAYAGYLEVRRHVGEIIRYDFEPEKLRLADGTFYTPDFRVILADWTIEFEEVKGRKGEGFWIEEDANVKVKVAAEIHPYPFFIVWPLKGGGWGKRRVGNSIT